MEQLKQQTKTNSERYSPTRNDVSVENCLFHDISSDQQGGAIGCNSVLRIFIEETTFTTCKTTERFGGGVFFLNSGRGECAIYHICCFNCSSQYTENSNTDGQCVYIRTKRDVSFKNEFNESTITGSKKESSNSWYALFLDNGNIKCSSTNITNNECCYYAALYCFTSEKAGVCTCFIICASIVNNSAKDGYGCIYLNNADSTHLISTSNIINSKQDDKTSYATIYANANVFINESCILGNNEGNKVFYELSSSCQIKITNCTLDSDIIKQSTRYHGSVTIISSKESSFINALSHIVTHKCESYFDSYGNLSVSANKAIKKGSKVRIHCMYHLDDMVILILLNIVMK